MVRIIGERKAMVKGEVTNTASYDFLVDKSNVTFVTIESEN